MDHSERFVEKNFQLYELQNDGMKLSIQAQANFCRNEIAYALRQGMMQVNLLLGGYDTKTGQSSLYFLDYLGSLQAIPYGCQGYGSYFCLSTMDRDYQPGMDQAAAIALIEKCIQEMQTRFLIAQTNFIIKIIDREGVRVHQFGADPADT